MDIFNLASLALQSLPTDSSHGLSFQSIFTIVLVFIATGAFFAIHHLYRENQKLQKQQADISENFGESYAFTTKLLKECPFHWIIWDLESDDLHFGEEVEKILSATSGALKVEQLLSLLEEKAALYLAEQLELLSTQGKFFHGTVALQGEERIMTMIGIPSNSSEQDTRITLWLRERRIEEEGSGIMSYTALKRLLDTLPFPIWHRDKNGRITYCNKTYADTLGQTVGDVLKNQETPWSDELTPSKNQDNIAASKREHIILLGDRKLVDFREMNLPYTRGRVGYTLDLSIAEIAQKKLESHISAHQEILERLSCGVTIYSSDQHLKFFNHAYARMYDLDESWLHTRPHLNEVLDLLNRKSMLPEQSDFPAYKRRAASMFTSLITPIQELSHLPDERTIRLITSPYPMGGMFFLFEDVTDSLVLERQTNTQLAVLKETLDNLYEGVIVFASNHTLKLFNPAFAKTWNLPASSLKQGMHINDLFEKLRDYFDYGDAWEPYKETIIDSFTDRTQKSGRINRKDGTVLEFSYVPLPDGSHLLRYFDISDGYRVEQALRERNEALETSDQMKTEFLDHVSYELKTPLNTIIGFSEILGSEYFGKMNEAQNAYCRGILNAARQQLNLVNDIVDLATIEAGHMLLNLQKVDLKKMLHSVMSMVHTRAEQYQLKLNLICEEEVDGFVADERRIKQAIFNILTNAIKFTPTGGDILIHAQKQNDIVEIKISDTGPGMNHSERRNVFRIFERGNRGIERYQGSGVGLSLVKSLIELHGGRIIIDSETGKGTTVICQIPLNLPPAPQQELLKIS